MKKKLSLNFGKFAIADTLFAQHVITNKGQHAACNTECKIINKKAEELMCDINMNTKIE